MTSGFILIPSAVETPSIPVSAGFTDVGRAAGDQYRQAPVEWGLIAGNRFHVDNWLGPGTVFAGYDNYDWLDPFVVGDGGLPNSLYRNNGDATFTDITEAAGIAQTGKGRGSVATQPANLYLVSRQLRIK